MCKFQVGDFVTLSQRGKRHIYSGPWGEMAMEKSGPNPWGISGIVLSIDRNYDEDNLPLRVEWSNGKRNCYSSFDLDFFNLSLENK